MRGHVAEVFGIDEAKITVVPNGVDPEDLQPVANLPRLRARYASPDERLVLLVGRLVYEKGFHLALDALPGVIERVGNVRFLVAGSGTAERDLKAQAEKLGLLPHGEFLGWIDDAMLHSLYAMSDLCVIPSLYEPFGLVALEAMASGCPCIVADTGGLREVVPGGERVGLRFTPRDAASLAERMETVLTDDALRARLVAEASEHILSFDWADVARRTAEVYARPRALTRGRAAHRLSHECHLDRLRRRDDFRREVTSMSPCEIEPLVASAEVVAERLERGDARVHAGLGAADAGARPDEGGGARGPRQALVRGRRLLHRLADRGGRRGVDRAGLDAAEVGGGERVGVGERGGGLALPDGRARSAQRRAPGLAARRERRRPRG